MKKTLSVLLVFFLLTAPKNVMYARGRFVCCPVWTANETSPCIHCRTEEVSYSFEGRFLQTFKTDKGLSLTYPGCQDYYFPGAPRIPFLNVPFNLASNEVISSVRVSFIQTQKLILDVSTLATFDCLKATNGEITPPGIALLPTRYPPTPFAYKTSGSFLAREGSIQIFPIYTADKQMYLITKITLLVLTRTFNQGPDPKPAKNHSIVVCPDELWEQARDLGKIQRLDGYQVEVAPLSMIQKDYEMADPPSFESISFFDDVSQDYRSRFSQYDSDTARKIRTFLGSRYQSGKCDFVTLLGDATYCPPSTYVFSPNNPDPYDRAIPTDFFYMTPLPEYDDYSLQIQVGRIPVRSIEEAKGYIDKVRRYRKAQRRSWVNSITLFGGDLFEDDYYGEIQSNFMIQQGNFKGQRVTKKYQSSGLYKRDSILSTLKEGNNGFISMSSHGRGDYLRLPHGYVDSTDILALPKQDKLPIFVSDSCLNGSWDTRLSGIRYGTDSQFSFPTSFSEALVLSQGGAIAYVGGSRINYAGMDYDYHNGLIQGHQLYNTDALLHKVLANYSEKGSSLGEISLLGLSNFIQEDMGYSGDWMLKAVFGFCLLGDPTIRLPGKQNVDLPTIKVTKMPLIRDSYIGDFPYLSLEHTNQFELVSSEKELTISFCDYDTWDNPLIRQEKITPNSQGYKFIVPKSPKTRLCIRIETPCGVEQRYVFRTRFQNDIRLVPPETFQNRRLGETTNMPLQIVNDGLDPAEDILVQVARKGKVFYKQVIPWINFRGVFDISLPLTFEESGSLIIEYSAMTQSKDRFPQDNQFTRNYIVSPQQSLRVGVFQYKYDSNGSQVSSKIWMNQINQSFTDQKKPMEVCWISKNQLEDIGTLGLDLFVLYDSLYLENEYSLTGSLEVFTDQGGKVLVIGPASKKIRSMVGLKTTEPYFIHQGDSSFQPFHLIAPVSSHFSRSVVSLPIFETLSPQKKPIEDIIKSGVTILGTSSDKLLYLTSYENYFYYSGLLSHLDFERSESVFTFFVELLGFTLSVTSPQYDFGWPGYVLPVPA